MWRPRGALKRRYDVVVVRARPRMGSRPPTTCERHGIRDVCVLDKSYIGSGPPEHDDHPLELPDPGRRRVLSRERSPVRAPAEPRLQSHVLPARHLTLAHSDRALVTMQERAE